MASSIHINHGYPHYDGEEYAENAVGVMVILDRPQPAPQPEMNDNIDGTYTGQLNSKRILVAIRY